MRKLLYPGLAIICISFSSEPAAAQACQDYFEQARQVAGAGPVNLEALRLLAIQASNSTRCNDEQKACFAALVADVHATEAAAMPEAEKAQAEQVANAGLAIAPTWRIAWLLAKFAELRKDFDRAAWLYQLAMGRLSQTKARIAAKSSLCSGEEDDLPKPAQEEELTHLTIQAGALARSFVRLSPARCGAAFQESSVAKLGCGETSRLPLPVEFRYGSTVLTPKGREIAKFLAELLVARASSGEPIVLTGHTDQKGTEAYNCALSKRRLDALVKFFRSNGLPPEAVIETIPQGSGEPFPVMDAASLSAEETDRINRRVELRQDSVRITRKCVASETGVQ